MKCLFMIHQSMKSERLEQQYLLMLAMLNFDFEVHLVFTEGAAEFWRHHQHWRKKLTALELYGIASVRELVTSGGDPGNLCQPGWYQGLADSADFIS